MPDEPKKTRLTPSEAKRKWGDLLGFAHTYRHFEKLAANGGQSYRQAS